MTGKGKVILVGAGPGSCALLTLRGKEAIENADVVLYDRLVGSEILSLIPGTAEKVDVGKSAGHHPVPQLEINRLLLRFAREGKCVVRLKGGDPYLFGRGAEELEAIVEQNIPFEVVPGITSAIAAPAFAGIPISHRNFSSSVHIITAHRKSAAVLELDYESLVKLQGTLIFLMGLATISELMTGLIGAGMAASTPAALIENGTRPEQRRLVATISDIAEQARREAFTSPSVLVVGSVCTLAEKLDWFSLLPLRGVKVVVTRPETRGTLSRKLRELGADVVDYPCIRTQPLPIPDEAFDALSKYGWIVFTSPYGAELFFESLKVRSIDIRSLFGARMAAVGAKTAAVIAERGICVDYVPETYKAEALAQGLPMESDLLKPLSRVMLFRAENGTPKLADILKARGFEVDDIAAYQTIRESVCSDEVGEGPDFGAVDLVVFTSASTVQGFTGSLPMLDLSELTAVCIGEETAAEARRHGFNVLVSDRATIESLIDCIIEHTRK